ncbi:MAG: HepT-like ribonuclease domain-containing protein, partial [Microcystaceae cyanobacterium]
MSRDSASVLDIFLAGKRVLTFTEGLSRSELETDVLRHSAILYQIEIMGEATKRLSIPFREQHSEIPWKDIAGMRDIIIHQYDRIDFDVVWRVIQHNIPD